MKYKIIFLDVDGTLYSHSTKSVPESTIRALKEAQSKGIKICIASGRSRLVTSFTGILDVLDFDYYVVTNGNLVIDRDNNVIYSSPMDKEGIKEVLSLVDKYELNATFMTLDDFYIKAPVYNPREHPLRSYMPSHRICRNHEAAQR